MNRFPRPPRGKSESFNSYWSTYIRQIADNPNFRKHHLKHLEILCDLHAEMDRMRDELEVSGTVYFCDGRNGAQYKLYPQVQQLERHRKSVVIYSKLLQLGIDKSPIPVGGPENEQDEWK